MKITFDQYYQNIYLERWPKLRAALLKERPKSALINPAIKSELFGKEILEFPKLIHPVQESFNLPKSPDLLPFYLLDSASCLATQNVEIKDQDRVLDLCSAPGGKFLSLYFKFGERAIWTVNEFSRQRRERLKRVLNQYLLPDQKNKIGVKSWDGTKIGLHKNHVEPFDWIIVDAPCSSEEHVLKNPVESAKWSPKRIKRLAATQMSMLCGALDCLKEGGKILYMTCSLAPLENELNIEKFLKKRKGKVWPINCPMEGPESLKYGGLFTPDQSGNGPLYFCYLKKVTTL